MICRDFHKLQLLHYRQIHYFFRLQKYQKLSLIHIYNGRGEVHGGVIAAMMDTTMGINAIALTEGSVSTSDMNISFLKPFRGKSFIIESEAVQVGRRVKMCIRDRGIYVHDDGFIFPEEEEEEEQRNAFAFRQTRSRETAFSYDYSSICDLLEYEKDHGYITWVLGPACTFDVRARESFSRLIEKGYVHAILAGNALATHDLEAAYMGTALGQNIVNQKPHFNGHYNHLITINAINTYGSIPAFIEGEGIDNGIIYSLSLIHI